MKTPATESFNVCIQEGAEVGVQCPRIVGKNVVPRETTVSTAWMGITSFAHFLKYHRNEKRKETERTTQ